MDDQNSKDKSTIDLSDSVSQYEEEDYLDELNASLARQISAEMDHMKPITEEKKKRKVPKGVKVFGIVFSVLMVMFSLLIFTNGGRKIIINIAGSYLYGRLDYEDSHKDDVDQSDIEDVTTVDETKKVEHVVNILLLGVEEIGGASNTDLIMIATMNTKDKSLKLTSLLRDLYVEIPGYSNNKLNSVYAKGGISLLYETIKKNFDITMDGYVMVNFSAFESIVDMLGGVEVTLTSTEANYLNTTNYISNPSYRTVVTGTQTLNGNQALGYTRVRKVSTGTENNDFGRTQRQRAILNAMFDKVKTKNIIQLGLLMNDILSNVNIQHDVLEKDFNSYLEEAISLKVSELENYRIPSDGTWQSQKVQIGQYKQDVLVPTDWEATRQELHEYIYGVEDVLESETNAEDVDATAEE